MTKKTWLEYATLISAVVCLMSISVLAQRNASERKLDRGDRGLTCDDNWFGNDRLQSHCEIKEQTLPATGGTISVDGRTNGGVSVKGWERREILVRARVQTAARTEAEARDLAGQIRIETGGAQIRAEGPSNSRDLQWSVSYEVFVPQQSDLSLKAHNGGISIADVRGRIEFEALNGGVALKRLAGNVRGHTTNGGVTVDLTGDRWDGEGLDVRTTNGGVTVAVPENYSARLETSTVNGGLKVGFPITVQGRIEKDLSIDLGSGGAPVRVSTTNGGVSINRKS